MDSTPSAESVARTTSDAEPIGDHGRVGVVFGSLTPPEQLARGAALAERLGFGELWFSEDCFFTGGISGVTRLLAATGTSPVGLGLASVVTRHPAILAMELAGLERMYPGRVRAAVGLGNRQWLDQLGLLPDRPLTAVAESFDALRDLLESRTVTGAAGPHRFDRVALDFPPIAPPPLWIGAVNERALRLAGAKADGVLLSVLSGPAYVRWAAGLVAEAASAAGRATPPITAFALAAVDADPGAAHDAVRDAVGFFLRAEAHTELVGRSPSAARIRGQLADRDSVTVEDAWIDEFAVAGTATQVAARLDQLYEAGADSVGLWPFPSDRFCEVLRRVAREVLPLVRARR